MNKDNDWTIIKKLAGFVGPHKVLFTITLALVIMSGILVTFFPKLMQLAIDGPIHNRDLTALKKLCLSFAGLMTLSLITSSASIYLSSLMGQKIIHTIRTRLMSHAQKLSMSYFNKTPVGILMSRMTSDVDLLLELYSETFISLVGSILTILFIVGFLMSINLKLFLMLLVIIPPLIIVSYWFKEKNRKHFQAIRGLNSRIMSFIQENVNGMRIVQLFGREKKNLKDFDVINGKYRDEYLKTVAAYSLYFPLINLINLSSIILVTVVGGWMYLKGEISIGALPAFMMYMVMFVEPLRRVAERYTGMQHSMAAAERIFHLLETNERIVEPENPVTPPNRIKGSIKFNNVSFHYKEAMPILKNISFEVKPGERLAIVGATGSGKTTTIKLINRFYDPISGSIEMDGIPIPEYSLKQLRTNIGVISQDHYLFSQSVYDNIRMGNENVSNEQIESICKNINIHDLITKLPEGYNTMLGQEGQTLSVGQSQLIAFSRLLVYDPKVLILDEATSNIDAASEKLVLDAMDKLMEGRTTIAIAHRLSTIKKVNRIIVIHKGMIVEEGTHEELLKNGEIYKKLYELQLSPENS